VISVTQPATAKVVILSGAKDLQLSFATFTLHNRWGAPGLSAAADETRESTNPNQRALYQGLAGRPGIHPRLPQTAQKTERALAPAETLEGAGAFRLLNQSTRRPGIPVPVRPRRTLRWLAPKANWCRRSRHSGNRDAVLIHRRYHLIKRIKGKNE
jgi:hypothetical protein